MTSTVSNTWPTHPAISSWFGQNVYDWFGVTIKEDVQASRLCLLRTQYRMTDQIGRVVSRLSYGDLLKHGRAANGPEVEFVDIDGEWQTNHYCVQEKSYYHLAAVPLLHTLYPFHSDELLFLSPFRPQRSLLAALAFDLRQSANVSRVVWRIGFSHLLTTKLTPVKPKDFSARIARTGIFTVE